MSHLKLLKDLKRYSLELSRPHPATVTTVGCSMDSSGRQTGRMESVSQHFSNISVFKQSRVPPEGLDEIFYQVNAHALGSFFFYLPQRQNQTKVGQSPARSHWHEGWHAGVEMLFSLLG